MLSTPSLYYFQDPRIREPEPADIHTDPGPGLIQPWHRPNLQAGLRILSSLDTRRSSHEIHTSDLEENVRGSFNPPDPPSGLLFAERAHAVFIPVDVSRTV